MANPTVHLKIIRAANLEKAGLFGSDVHYVMVGHRNVRSMDVKAITWHGITSKVVGLTPEWNKVHNTTKIPADSVIILRVYSEGRVAQHCCVHNLPFVP